MACDTGCDYFTASDAKPIKFFNPVRICYITPQRIISFCRILDWSIGCWRIHRSVVVVVCYYTTQQQRLTFCTTDLVCKKFPVNCLWRREMTARTWRSSAKWVSIQKADWCIKYLAAKSGHEFIHAQSIKELMGMIEWEERQYFLNQKTSLILPCA